MPEVTHAGQHHRDIVLVGGAYHFVVAHRAAGLDHAGRARSSPEGGTATSAPSPPKANIVIILSLPHFSDRDAYTRVSDEGDENHFYMLDDKDDDAGL